MQQGLADRQATALEGSPEAFLGIVVVCRPSKFRRRGKGPSTILAAFGVARPEPTAQALQGPVKIPRSWLSVAQTPEPQAQSKKQRLRACTNIKYILGTRGRIMDGWMHACMHGWMDGWKDGMYGMDLHNSTHSFCVCAAWQGARVCHIGNVTGRNGMAACRAMLLTAMPICHVTFVFATISTIFIQSHRRKAFSRKAYRGPDLFLAHTGPDEDREVS